MSFYLADAWIFEDKTIISAIALLLLLLLLLLLMLAIKVPYQKDTLWSQSVWELRQKDVKCVIRVEPGKKYVKK